MEYQYEGAGEYDWCVKYQCEGAGEYDWCVEYQCEGAGEYDWCVEYQLLNVNALTLADLDLCISVDEDEVQSCSKCVLRLFLNDISRRETWGQSHTWYVGEPY